MEIAFNTRVLRDLCGNEDALKQKFGIAAAQALKHRLADLRAAASIADVVLGNPRPAASGIGKAIYIDLVEPWRAVFSVNHAKPPLKEKRVDWSRVTRIKLMRVEVSRD